MSELNPQQLRLVSEYIADPKRNGRAAAVRAGYSPVSAKTLAYQVLSKPEAIEMIKKADKTRATKLGFTAERVLSELAKIAFADLSKGVSYDDEGNPVASDISEMAVETSSNEKGNRTKSVKIRTVKPADKVSALVQIGKHLGIFADKVEVTGNLSLIDLVTQSFKEPELTEIPALEPEDESSSV